MNANTKLITIIALISLTVSILQSCKKDTKNTNQLPSCKISTPTSGQEITKGEIITISVSAEDNDGNITEVRVFVDDVFKSSVSASPYNFEWPTVSESPGSHVITATSIDNDGGINSDEISIEIIGPVNTNFSADQVFGVVPLIVNFSDSSTNNPTSWSWDFGDGNTSTLQNPSHTYSDTGSYTISLIAINNFSADTITRADYITASNTGVFTDPRDGQTYDIVNIGGQVWFAENLNFEVANSSWYENDAANGEVYGRLYTWEAALEAGPPGWHLPTDDEWKALEMFLGMSQSQANGTGLRGTDEGTKLKNTFGWNSGGNGTNTVGFTALPGGRSINGEDFERLGNYGYWWTSTEATDNMVWYRRLFSDHTQSVRDFGDGSVHFKSVRVVRD